MLRRYLIRAAITGFVLTWILLFSYLLRDFNAALFAFGPDEIARRVTAPDGSKTALLERALDLDLNFRLYIVESPNAPNPNDRGKALWTSGDYEPTIRRNWREDLEWSADSSIIAVSIEGQYVFAYDFRTSQPIDDSDQIRQLLTTRTASLQLMAGMVSR